MSQGNEPSPDPRLEAAKILLQRIEDWIAKSPSPPRVVGFIAGGLCAYRHGSPRPSDEVDGFFHAKLLLPPNLEAPFVDQEGKLRTMSWDRGYFRDIGLIHPDYASRSVPFWQGEKGLLTINMLGADDLAVTKIGRWSPSDQEDIAAMAALGKLAPDRLRTLAEEALSYFVGNPAPVQHNLQEALDLVQEKMLVAQRAV